MMTQDELDRELAIGRDKFLELLEKHRGPASDGVRDVATRAFDAGAQWGVVVLLKASGGRVPRWLIDAIMAGGEQ